MTRPRVRTATWLVILVVTASLGAGRPATAQVEADGSGASLALVALTPVVRPGGQIDATVTVSTSRPATDLEVAFRIGPIISSRDAFAQAAGGRPSTTALSFATREVEAGPAGAQASLTLRVTGSGRSTSEHVALTRPGVYPLTVTLREADGGDELASLVTFVVRGEVEPPKEQFLFSWIWPVYTAPAPAPSEAATVPALDASAEGHLDTISAAAVTSPVGVTLWPVPQTVDVLRRLSAENLDAGTMIERLSRTGGRLEMLAGPYAAGATNGWSALPGELSRQLRAGASTLASALGSTPTSATAIVIGEPSGAEIGQLVASQGASAVVLRGGSAVDRSRKVDVTKPVLMEGTGQTRVLVSDSDLEADLADDSGPVAAAQRLLADLTILRSQDPAETRGAVLLPQLDWKPSSALLREATARLAAADHIRVVPITDLAATVTTATEDGRPRGRPVVVEAPAGSGLTDGAAAQYAAISAARVHADQLATMLTPAAGPRPALLDDVERTLLEAPDDELVRNEHAATYADRVEAEFTGVVNALSVPTEASITLTSESGRVPVTIRNDSPYPMNLGVNLIPEVAVRVSGQNHRVVTVEAGRSRTEEFEIETAGPGTHRMLLRVTPPDGSAVLAETAVELRSTGASWVATALTVGSLAFLALWWLLHTWARTRGGKHARARRAHPAGSAGRRLRPVSGAVRRRGRDRVTAEPAPENDLGTPTAAAAAAAAGRTGPPLDRK